MKSSNSVEELATNAVGEGHRSGYVALIGPANAGKSTLLNAILGAKVSIVSPKPQTTRNRVVGIKHYPSAELVFVDTPGFLERKVPGGLGSLLTRELQEAGGDVDFSVLVLDANALRKDVSLFKRIRSMLGRARVPNPGLVLLNKIDLFPRDELLPLIAAVDRELRQHLDQNAEIVPVSALSADGIEVVEEILVSQLPEGPRFFPEGSRTSQTEEFFVTEIIREKLYCELNQELPYSIAVVIDGIEESEELLQINAAILVERSSQKAVVIGAGGQKLKQVGTRARHELEKAFGVKVLLKLFVRVEKNWTKSSSGMRAAGYTNES